MDLSSQPLPAPRQQQQQQQQQQLRDANAEREDSTQQPAAAASILEIHGVPRLQDHPRAAGSSLHRPATNASTHVGSTTLLAAGLPGQPRLNHSVSHFQLQVRQHEQQQQSHASRFTNVRARILRPHQSSFELSTTQKKERLLPRPAGSSNILRRASERTIQERGGAKSSSSIRDKETVPASKDVECIAVWKKKILNASKAARKGGRVEIDIIEALEPSQTKRKASASTSRKKVPSSNNYSTLQNGRNSIHGSIDGNSKVSLRSTRIAPVDSGSRGPSPSRAPSEPRPSPCKDNERSINRDLPLLINASHVDSFQEEEDGSLCSTPDTSILDSLPRQSDVEEQDFAPQGSPNATTDGYSCHEIKGPAIVVNHPVSKKHPHRDEPLVIMETTATSFKSSRFDYSDCFNNATAQTSQEASGADAHFQESKEITPQLFDDILPHMHSPFVARYAHFDGSFSKAVEPHARLVAALPSRIVAQIASDSFMDYELVSDFFLTFRSYLDPQRLLQLLFARLEWSLDRKTADGRIVRIRTFAALRHWVLNYFVDDFMHETDGWELRNAFCDRLNELYRRTQNRISTVSPQEPETRLGDMKDQPAAVASDLKVLIDLKRCWIGQCAIFCGSGSSDHGVTAGVGDSFNGDEDIEPEFSPQPQTCASQSPGAGSDGQPVKRLSRYTDVRFSHYGAFRSNDSTALPVRSRTGSTVSFDMDFESIDKPLSVDETREAAARLGQPCLRRVGHVKTDSQSSAGSFQSAHSKRHADAKSKHSRNFSDSLRTEPPQFQRSLSTKSRPRPTSQICLETLGRRNHEVRELESPVSGQDVGQKTLNQPRLAGMSQPAGSVVNEARVPSPVHDAIVNDIPALIPPQSLIRGTMFAPIDGIAHVLGRELSTLPSQSTCGRQSSHHLQRPFQSHHDDHHRPRTNGWKKDEINLTFEEPRSSNEVNVLTTDTLKTTTNGGSTDVSESIPPNTSLQSPRRLGQPPLESSIQSTTLPVLATITSVPEGHPNLDSLKAEVRTSIGEEHEDHSVSAAPGVKHLVGTPSLDSLNRKHSNKDLQTTNCDGHNNAYHNSDGEGNLSSKGILPAADFPGEFHSKRHANHMHSSSGSSLQSQVHRASFEPHRNSERWTSHDTSPPADQRGNRISQFAVPFGRHGEVSTSSGTPSSTNAQLANAASVGNNGYGTVGSTSVGGYYPRDKTQPGGLAKDGRNASLEIKTDEELRILRWLHNDKEIRIDLLAEYAAERYLEKFKQAKDKKQQSCLSNSVLMTPDASTCSIQIRTPCANEQTSEHIKAEVQRALSKASASDLSENSQSHNPSQPSSPISPITQSNRPLSVVGRGQSKTHSPNAINASLQIQNATTAPVSQSNKYPFCHSSSISPAYAGLGFGLDLSDRIPRRPSGQTPSNENTLSFGIPIPRRFPKPIGKPNKSVQGEVPTPAAYKGPELATVESGPPTERNSDDSDSSGGRLSRSRDGARAALNAKKSECKERDNIEVEEAELKRSLTNMTQTTQLSQSTEHSYSKAWSKNGNSSERGGTVARSMKFLGNKLRNNASFQGGMFKLNFRRRRDIDVHLNRFGDQSHEPSQSNGGMLPRWGKSKHTAHSDNVNVPGRVLEYRPLNVSSFDIDARIEESDGESAAIQSPLDHPSSISHSLTPSPYLCQRSKTISQSDGRSQSARALRAPENEREEGSIPRDAVPLYTDTDPSVTVKRPYHTSELAWRGFRSMDSLIEKPPKAGGCPVSSGRASTAQAAEDTDFPALHTLKTVLVSSTQESMFKATDSGEHVAADGTLMPKLAGENGGNVPNDVEASLGLEAKLEQIPGKTSSKRSSSFLRYPLNPEDRAELTNKELVHNDDTTVNDGQCPGNTSIGSDIDRKITDSSSAHGDQMQHNECINAGTPNRSAQQDLNSMQNSYQQDFHHLKDCVNNAVPSPQCLDGVTPGNCDEKTSSRQDQIESASGTRHDECSQPSFGAEPTAGESAVPSEKATSNDISPSSSAHLRERNAVSDAGHQDPEDKTKASPPDYFKSRPPTSLTEHDVARLYAKYKHAPFILAYDSKVLAEQLTLIEVSALSEIDWGDLVNMKWSNDQQTLDWATYLATDDRKGINMVIARFNLMVKWIVSEVVLTRNIHERARAISQFIHIALEARRMRNFSTMVQVTVALSSTDCVSLKNTWALVDVESKCAFAKMELLVQPLRNFKELRTEMESLGLRECCVPFVGLYVQDLKYNAQKPSHIQVEGGAQPLVNLEKYRTSASIVKSLLRLIDASTRYEFTPVSGVFERCLWISCLKDEDIRVLSKSLEL